MHEFLLALDPTAIAPAILDSLNQAKDWVVQVGSALAALSCVALTLGFLLNR